MTKTDTRGALQFEFSEPIDLHYFRPQLAISTDQRILPWIRAYDTDGARIDYRCTAQPELNFQYFDFGIDNFEGRPNMSQITKVQIIVFVGSDSSREFVVDDLRFVES